MEDPGLPGIVARLGLALVLAAALGWDRERRAKPAGLRTHMLVALGAAGFTLVGVELAGKESSTDLARVIQGIVGGIGFLGAGAIIQARGNIQGITTAAGIWATAAIGVACGLGEYMLAIILGGLAFGVLTVAVVFEYRMGGSEKEREGDDHPMTGE